MKDRVEYEIYNLVSNKLYIIKRFLLNLHTAVSYTHLDVYKRQVQIVINSM